MKHFTFLNSIFISRLFGEASSPGATGETNWTGFSFIIGPVLTGLISITEMYNKINLSLLLFTFIHFFLSKGPMVEVSK